MQLCSPLRWYTCALPTGLIWARPCFRLWHYTLWRRRRCWIRSAQHVRYLWVLLSAFRHCFISFSITQWFGFWMTTRNAFGIVAHALSCARAVYYLTVHSCEQLCKFKHWLVNTVRCCYWYLQRCFAIFRECGSLWRSLARLLLTLNPRRTRRCVHTHLANIWCVSRGDPSARDVRFQMCNKCTV